ncbi:hypothetical protein AX15_005595 [Amanita polypyramis BW_CC]|nr:hypothetical protein AX15_005595 [Amanita polypyramis BW_CC]
MSNPGTSTNAPLDPSTPLAQLIHTLVESFRPFRVVVLFRQEDEEKASVRGERVVDYDGPDVGGSDYWADDDSIVKSISGTKYTTLSHLCNSALFLSSPRGICSPNSIVGSIPLPHNAPQDILFYFYTYCITEACQTGKLNRVLGGSFENVTVRAKYVTITAAGVDQVSKLQGGVVLAGGRGFGSRGRGWSSRLEALFWIAISNFVIPVILSIVQLVIVWTSSDIFTVVPVCLVNIYVGIIGVLLATVWATGMRWEEEERTGSGLVLTTVEVDTSTSDEVNEASETKQ